MRMSDTAQRAAAKQFAAEWAGRGYEKGDTAVFWLGLLSRVFGLEKPGDYVKFEEEVQNVHRNFIDVRIPATKVLIEQKSLNKDLSKPIRQSDGSLLTPFQQAKKYISSLPLSQHPRYVVACNFAEFWVYDMENPNGEPAVIRLADLPKEYYRLQFLVPGENEHLEKELEVSIQAGELVGKMYDALRAQYIDPDSERSMKSLNVLCVRLVFCLYAEDAGIFGAREMFHDYLASFRPENVRRALMDLFRVLDQPQADRDPYMDDKLAAFPYVNGGLFADEDIEIPRINADVVELLLRECSEGFDWSAISPTIFGAVFESTLNPETRRSGGMHYTSIENIHKVIDPLFLDGLKKEFRTIRDLKDRRRRNARLKAFQTHLAGLTFLDPACGSGNFLTETYLSLRRIENEVISLLNEGSMVLGGLDNPIQVSIDHFYGIEINDFAVTVAKTALWIAESQMMKETEAIVHMDLDFLPLTTNAYIHEGNALRMDWTQVISPERLSYLIGNPPFVGYSLQSRSQKNDIKDIYVDDTGKPYRGAGKIDYVAGWYFKAAEYMRHTPVRAAFVSTNSITQGEQVAGVWRPIMERFGAHIDFAWRTFKWGSESNSQAAVHCVIIGFSDGVDAAPKVIYDAGRERVATHINPYLNDAPTVFIEPRRKPLASAVPAMTRGSQPTDNGNLILTREEREALLEKEPQAAPLLRPFMMGKDFIHRMPRYCLWLVGADPSLLKRCPEVLTRIEKVREFRLASKKTATQKKAQTPQLFDEIKASDTSYIALPKVSSENRRYIPMDYLPAEVIAGDKLFMVPDASLYYFGVLMSNVHMAWMRAVAGRLKSDYSYSNTVVYNNFPWPSPTKSQQERVERTAQQILDARAVYPQASLADLYDELTMPPELRKAHQENDKAVMTAYGFDWRKMTESDCVAALMRMYQKLTTKKDTAE